MSHDQGRPSLFAGMEDGAAPGSDTQRVRILSTLESTRRPQRPARKGPPSKGGEHPGVKRAWFITLGLGAVALLLSFVLIIQSHRPALVKPASVAQAGPLVAPVAPSQPEVPPSAPVAPVAPIVEANAPALESTIESSPPAAAASSATQNAERDPLAALSIAVAPVDQVASAPPVKDAPAAISKNATASAKPAKPSKSAGGAKAKGRGNDQDVELIEAVINHAHSRPDSRPDSRSKTHADSR